MKVISFTIHSFIILFLIQREKEILQLIAQRKETEAIAEILTISRNTVNNHRQNMLDKICAKDTTALIEFAN